MQLDAARAQLLADGESFVTETVFSDPVGAKLQFLRDAIAANYRVTLYYVGISSAQLSEARVSQRVKDSVGNNVSVVPRCVSRSESFLRASKTLLFPEPFGPTRTVKGSNSIVTFAKHLKLSA